VGENADIAVFGEVLHALIASVMGFRRRAGGALLVGIPDLAIP
jgi:hypothetical protein